MYIYLKVFSRGEVKSGAEGRLYIADLSFAREQQSYILSQLCAIISYRIKCMEALTFSLT